MMAERLTLAQVPPEEIIVQDEILGGWPGEKPYSAGANAAQLSSAHPDVHNLPDILVAQKI
jgi:hypothetical protein